MIESKTIIVAQSLANPIRSMFAQRFVGIRVRRVDFFLASTCPVRNKISRSCSCHVFLHSRIPRLLSHITSCSPCGHEFAYAQIMNRGFERDDLMAILDSIDDAVVKLNAKAQFVAMNQAAITIYERLGFNPQEMKGKSVWEVFPDLRDTIVERELQSVIEDHTQVSFEFYYPKDQHCYETKGYSVPPGAVLVFRVITDRKSTAS